MTIDQIQHFPLGRAYLCPDCGCVTDFSQSCPSCTNGVLVPLASVLKEVDSEGPREQSSSSQ